MGTEINKEGKTKGRKWNRNTEHQNNNRLCVCRRENFGSNKKGKGAFEQTGSQVDGENSNVGRDEEAGPFQQAPVQDSVAVVGPCSLPARGQQAASMGPCSSKRARLMHYSAALITSGTPTRSSAATANPSFLFNTERSPRVTAPRPTSHPGAAGLGPQPGCD